MKFFIFILFFLSSCSYVEKLKKSVQEKNKMDGAALRLSKENRELRARVIQIEAELKNSYVDRKKVKRSISSYSAQRFQNIDNTWKADEIIFVAEIEFEREDFEKSSYFFETLFRNFPENKLIDDQLLFKAGRSFYLDGKNIKMAKEAFGKIITLFPKSKFFLQSKLWLALIYHKQDEKNKFKESLKEFNEKYQNTSEWKILEKHYEKIIKK